VIGWLDTNLVSILNGVAFGMLLYMMAIGLSLMYGMMGVLNLAHGSLFLLGAYLAVQIVGVRTGWTYLALACGLALLIGAGTGVGIGVMTRPLVPRGHMDQAILTLGIFLAAGSLMSSGFGADAQSVPTPSLLAGQVSVLGHEYPVYRLVVIGLGVLTAVVVEIVLVRTVVGATIRAIVADEQMVKAIGIDTRQLYYGVFGAGAALAVLAGVLGSPILGAAPGLDSQVLLIALVVVVVGGLGSARGALAGAMLIGVVQNLGTALVPQLAPFLVFGTMAAVLVLWPQGLLQARVAR
jgi:branched-chain amino acid transport system permease protein